MLSTNLGVDDLLAEFADTVEESRFLPGLTALVLALRDEARLTAAGCAAVRKSLAQVLTLQNRIKTIGHTHPELMVEQARQPVFITGLHRSGTTLLQSLVATHPDVRAPQLWELLAPVGSGGRRRLTRAAEEYVAEYYRVAPAFQAIHSLAADKPEECHRLMANSFMSDIYALRYRVPSYWSWLDEQDHTVAYRYHRQQLNLLLRRWPGDVVLLKCPFHLWHPRELAASYPEARVVRLHRDPGVTVASISSLCRVVRAARSDDVDAGEIGRFWLQRTEQALGDPQATGRTFGGLPTLDLTYPEVARDPVAAAVKVCRYIGLSVSARDRDRMSGQLAATRATGPGAHRYDSTDFGLEPAAIRERLAGYLSAFGI